MVKNPAGGFMFTNNSYDIKKITKMYYNNILETIGNTPLVKLNKITSEIPATILAKIESFNPGHSIKDRIGIQMIEDAEKDGLIKPGGTIIEGTSGNTGMGLAIAAIVKGYKCICTTTDKQSQEKIDILRAVNVKVIVCPTNVPPEDPRSYYSVAQKLSEEIPNSFYPNQYFNLSNRKAHYLTTGPEIWEATEGRITHFIAGVGTGGTISGVAKYLKEKNPDIKIWGIDTYGSLFKKYHETGEIDPDEVYPYLTEGIGEDIIPSNVDFSLIDLFEKVSDKDAYVMTRRLAKEEGIMAGNSSGSAVAGVLQLAKKLKKDDVVVVVLPDHGSRYIAKVFNDDWMRERGFMETSEMKISDVISVKNNRGLISIDKKSTVQDAIEIMRSKGISQIPVSDNGEITGSVSENGLYADLIENPELKHLSIENIMKEPFPVVDADDSTGKLPALLSQNNAVLVKMPEGYEIITKYDMIRAI